MSSARLLPGEQRRPAFKPSVEEAKEKPGRSVRSIRQRFEAETLGGTSSSSALQTQQKQQHTTSSAPSTPAKKRNAGSSNRSTQTKTQAELAAFLQERASNSQQQQQHNHHLQQPLRPSHRESATMDPSPANVGSLIEKWSTAASVPRQHYVDRNPLQERHLQRPDHAYASTPRHTQLQQHQQAQTQQGSSSNAGSMVDSVDTFGSSSVDLDQLIPKTDPGRLENYAMQARLLAQQATAQQQQQQNNNNNNNDNNSPAAHSNHQGLHNHHPHQFQGRPPIAAAVQHPISGDATFKELVTRGMVQQPHNQDTTPNRKNHKNVTTTTTEEQVVVCRTKSHHKPTVDMNQNLQNRVEHFIHMSPEQTETEVVVQVKQTTIRNETASPPPNSMMKLSPCTDQFDTSSISPGSEENIDSNNINPPIITTDNNNTNNTIINESIIQASSSQQGGVENDYSGEDYIRELFAEAEETAERAVQCDENEEYFAAFELYWGVVDLYSKVIPFLTPAEGVDVHERIKMYTRRCEAIREAFEDDEADAEEAAEVSAEQQQQQNDDGTGGVGVVAGEIDEIDETPPQSHAPVPNGVPQQNDTYQNLMGAFENVHLTGEDTIPRNPAEKVNMSSAVTHNDTPSASVSQSVGNQKKNTKPLVVDKDDHIQQQQQQPQQPQQQNRTQPSSSTIKQSNNNDQGETSTIGELRRTPYPDHSERALAEATDARTRPGFLVSAGNVNGTGTSTTTGTTPTGLSASTQAHRNSLSRPISRSAARASTNSVSKERMNEMQERVALMQECLNNFTVKQKHLGPARALELAVTTLNANTFGDLKKLEPLAPDLEHKWATELGVLLSMLKEIKVVRPGIGFALREDIAKHLPSLERCDRSVRKTVRSFSALSGHVRYVERETAANGNSSKGGRGRRRWWVKVPVVDHGGLNSEVLKIVEEAEQEMRSVFKICHEINVEVVKSIPVPISFVEGLPKHARSLIPRELKEGLTTWGMFKVSDYMKDRNMWNKESAKEITSCLEKVALIWEARTSNKSFLSRTFDIRGERFHQAMTAFRRCQNAIRDLRREWPTMQHTELDMAKIQNNEDIGLAGLEAYSRALESRAYRLLTRIRELLDANSEAIREGNTTNSSKKQ